uniref:Uncharacterized protein n=1 Tax=Cacopsylla melanoneura TaxID=428564 RepID=A0A8D8WG38_9HEMI
MFKWEFLSKPNRFGRRMLILLSELRSVTGANRSLSNVQVWSIRMYAFSGGTGAFSVSPKDPAPSSPSYTVLPNSPLLIFIRLSFMCSSSSSFGVDFRDKISSLVSYADRIVSVLLNWVTISLWSPL